MVCNMVILHICAVENKMSNGATVAALNHINEQAKTIQVYEDKVRKLNGELTLLKNERKNG